MYSLIQFFSPCVLFRMVQHISTHKSMGPPTRISVWQIERKNMSCVNVRLNAEQTKAVIYRSDTWKLGWISAIWYEFLVVGFVANRQWNYSTFCLCLSQFNQDLELPEFFFSFRFHFGNTQNKWSDSKHDAWYFSVRGDSYIALANSSNNTNHKLSLFRHDFI